MRCMEYTNIQVLPTFQAWRKNQVSALVSWVRYAAYANGSPHMVNAIAPIYPITSIIRYCFGLFDCAPGSFHLFDPFCVKIRVAEYSFQLFQ